MKIILGIICGLVALFAGGCAVALVFSQLSGDSGGAGFALFPAGIAVLNVLVIMGLFGQSRPRDWAFYVLAGLDVVAAVVMAVFWSSISSQVNDFWAIAVPVIGVLLLKAVLTVIMVRKLMAPPQG